jgi:hypothetical protein
MNSIFRRATRSAFILASVSCGIAIAASHCGGTVQHTQAFPTNHREVGASCSPTRPPGITDAGTPADAGPVDAGGFPQSQCAVDADCTKGKNGRCMSGGHLPGNVCTYDACTVDADCPSGSACFCDSTGNRCLASNCTTDATCNGLGCSPTYGTSCGPFSGYQGVYCHTSSDTCVNDKDCTAQGPGYCAFDPKVGSWACAYTMCAG